MKHRPHLLVAILIGCIIFLFELLMRYLNVGTVVFDMILLKYFAYSILYSVVLYGVNATLHVYLDEYFKNDIYSAKRIIVGFFTSFFVTLLFIFLLRILIFVGFEKINFQLFLQKESPQEYVHSSIITFIVLLIFHAIFFYKSFQENRVKEQKIIAGTANAKFESLKNQIDPHFLFNSLNVLSSLIEENPENAQRFTVSLSKIYRYVLEQKDKELVSVEEELAFAKTYMNLLKMRFENSLTYEMSMTQILVANTNEDMRIPYSVKNQIVSTYEIDIENVNPVAKVVPLSLQLLLENTIKHNVISEQKPLHIKIYVENDFLCIKNNYQKKEVLQERNGVGLQNIINRYGIITNRKVLIEQNDNFFTVKIPILTKQISVMETVNNGENNAYFRAKERVRKLKGFYGNLTSYCIVIPILVFINLNYTPEFQWFWFSAGGWGLGVFFHAFETFGYGKSWEEKKIQEILNSGNDKIKKWN